METITNPDILRKNVRKWTRELIDRSRNENLLYHLLNVLSLWGTRGDPKDRPRITTLDFQIQLNRFVEELVLRPTRNGQGVNSEHALFVYQWLYEAKSVPALLRNFCRIVSHGYATCEPWIADDFAGDQYLHTRRVNRNTVDELRGVGAVDLASAYKNVHEGDAAELRNSIAHGNVLVMDEATNHEWILGTYIKPMGESHLVGLIRKNITSEQFNVLMTNLMAMKLGFIEEIGDEIEALRSKEMEFVATNQMDRKQQLECKYDHTGLTIKYQGTPMW